MSTGLECSIFEHKPGKWYYALQDWDCPVGADDWREYATAYGPFPSEEKAEEHLDENHANPGGFCVDSYVEGHKPDEAELALVKHAVRPVPSYSRSRRW